jgi:hypothetical protein
MSEELATIGMTSATALITAMTSDGWNTVRAWVGRWLGRGRAEEETVHLVRLDRDREHLLATQEAEVRAESERLAAVWAVRLQDVVEIDKNAARELLDWANRWRAENPDVVSRATAVRQNAKARGHARITQVGGNQTFVPRDES